jgi:hypothetical protein
MRSGSAYAASAARVNATPQLGHVAAGDAAIS